jgi:2-dehydro-3-deoxyphosphooctonate aldolase (KDO 8-P synthase)
MLLCNTPIGLDEKMFLIAGPCVIESEDIAFRTAETLSEIAAKLDILIIYKSSFDKANRSSHSSFRGPGMDEGLRILDNIRQQFGLPILTDVHEIDQVAPVASVVDILQTPAFLARQTDFINAVAACGKPVNIKKGQFMAPQDMAHVVAKARAAAKDAGVDADNVMVCERGASFGYNNLVSDMRSLAIMRCNCRAVMVRHQVGSARWCLFLPAPPLLRASPAYSWKPIPIPITPCPMAQMRGH